MRPYSDDVRAKVIAAYANEEGARRDSAKRFGVRLNCVGLLLERYRETGKVDPKPQGGGPPRAIAGKDAKTLRRRVTAPPDAPLAEFGERFERRTGRVVSRSTRARTFERLKDARTKKSFHATARDHNEDVQAARRASQAEPPARDARRLIVVEACGTPLGMTRTHARALTGQRVQGTQPAHAENISVIGARGRGERRAALRVAGAIEGQSFTTFIKELLVPVLQPGDPVVMDTLSVHKTHGVEAAICATGATVQYLPPYSPAFSPLENCWSKGKEFLRKAGARTVNALQKALTEALEAITESDTKGGFQHCGYCIEAN